MNVSNAEIWATNVNEDCCVFKTGLFLSIQSMLVQTIKVRVPHVKHIGLDFIVLYTAQ